jgi:two-component sensor histidine kinase/CHASE1-domain containing sensor protein
MDDALLARVEKQAWFHKYPRGWPFLLFVLTSIVTLVSVLAIESAEAQRRQLELDRNVTEIASGLQRRTSENIVLLRAAAALFTSKHAISQQEFAEFAAGLHANGDLHGSLGIGWARLVDVADVPQFEASVRSREASQFLVYPRPQQSQSVAVPIVYLEPLSAVNRKAIGYDMYSEPIRREAMDAAIRKTQPVASGKVHLVQDQGDSGAPGFLIYMPVFRWESGQRIATGFVYSPFRADEFLDSAAELFRNRDIDIAIYDEIVGPEHVLALRERPGRNSISMQRRIQLGDREWILRVSHKMTATLSPLSRATLLFGAIVALLIMFIARVLTKRAAEDRQVLEWLTRQSAIRNSLTRELNHRVKNTLANVLSIVALTRRRSTGIDDFAESLTARVRALSATHDLLSQSNWSHAPIGEVIRSELAPYMEGAETHVEMSGPDVSLAPNDALSLGLAIHELATNAAKYGALSTIDGRIHVTWSLLTPELAAVHWRETGGPPVSPPIKRGFGRDLIEKIVAGELKSDIDLQFRPGGVECRLQVPVRKLGKFALRSGASDPPIS